MLWVATYRIFKFSVPWNREYMYIWHWLANSAFSFLSLLELKNERALQVQVYKCNCKKKIYKEHCICLYESRCNNMNKELFLWNSCSVSRTSKKIIRWKKSLFLSYTDTCTCIWFFMKEKYVVHLDKRSGMYWTTDRGTHLELQFMGSCHCI